MCTECQGECKDDSECAGSLKCYIREDARTARDAGSGEFMRYRQPVPGCMSRDEQFRHQSRVGFVQTQRDDKNYCYDPQRFSNTIINSCRFENQKV